MNDVHCFRVGANRAVGTKARTFCQSTQAYLSAVVIYKWPPPQPRSVWKQFGSASTSTKKERGTSQPELGGGSTLSRGQVRICAGAVWPSACLPRSRRWPRVSAEGATRLMASEKWSTFSRMVRMERENDSFLGFFLQVCATGVTVMRSYAVSLETIGLAYMSILTYYPFIQPTSTKGYDACKVYVWILLLLSL